LSGNNRETIKIGLTVKVIKKRPEDRKDKWRNSKGNIDQIQISSPWNQSNFRRWNNW